MQSPRVDVYNALSALPYRTAFIARNDCGTIVAERRWRWFGIGTDCASRLSDFYGDQQAIKLALFSYQINFLKKLILTQLRKNAGVAA